METNEFLGVYIKHLNLDEPDFFLCKPSIDVYLIDKHTETCTRGNSEESNMNLYQSPFSLTESNLVNRSVSDNWNRLTVISENFKDLNSDSKQLMFEISKKVKRKRTQDLESKRIAWAFLRPVATDGSMNTNKDLKLQLYKVGKSCKVSHQDCNIYHLYSDHKLKKLTGYLTVSVDGVVRKTSEFCAKKNEEKNEKKTIDGSPRQQPSPKIWKWSRLPTQTCRIPNKIHRTYNISRNGVSCLQFSRKGLYMASAVLSNILVHDVVTGDEIITLNSHMGFIYELNWSFDDEHLLSVSNDCRGAVWSLHQKTPLFVLPHPCFVYCGKWFGDDERIVTGGRDRMLRVWIKTDGGFDLKEEIPGHSGYVSTIATLEDSLVFSGDSHGRLMIRKYSDGCLSLLRELSWADVSKNVVDSIHLHCSRRRIVVSIRGFGSCLVDVNSGVVLQSYKTYVRSYVRSISCLTPCGSLLFSFRSNAEVGVWEVNTGKLLATYDSLYSCDRVIDFSGCIHYHSQDHLVVVGVLGLNYPLLLLRYENSKSDDAKLLGLTFTNKKTENFSVLTTQLS